MCLTCYKKLVILFFMFPHLGYIGHVMATVYILGMCSMHFFYSTTDFLFFWFPILIHVLCAAVIRWNSPAGTINILRHLHCVVLFFVACSYCLNPLFYPTTSVVKVLCETL